MGKKLNYLKKKRQMWLKFIEDGPFALIPFEIKRDIRTIIKFTMFPFVKRKLQNYNDRLKFLSKTELRTVKRSLNLHPRYNSKTI